MKKVLLFLSVLHAYALHFPTVSPMEILISSAIEKEFVSLLTHPKVGLFATAALGIGAIKIVSSSAISASDSLSRAYLSMSNVHEKTNVQAFHDSTTRKAHNFFSAGVKLASCIGYAYAIYTFAKK